MKINSIENKTKVCLCAIGKKENLYIKEFINHYKQLGYNHIYLYDNNDENDERFEDIIQEDINEGYVTLINYRGFRGIKNNPQLDAYYDCYEKNNKKYKWLSFFDIDEFLEIKPNNITIQEFFDNKRYYKCEHIKMHWIVYSDNNLLYYENKQIKERFTLESSYKKINKHIKSTVRGNLSHNYWKIAWTPHSTTDEFYSCTSSGKKVDSVQFFFTPDYEYGFLRHYPTKTIEEFCKKIKKGFATHQFEYNLKDYKERFTYFFQINQKTKEKVDYFNKVFNMTFT